jgi:hypothetical protein
MLQYKDVFYFTTQFAQAFGIPIVIILVVIILKPSIFKFLDRLTSVSVGPTLVSLGETFDGAHRDFRSDETRKLLSEPKEEIEKLRIFLETEQIKQLITYHQNGLYQSRVSFWFSIGSACFGFLIIAVGVVYIFAGAQTTASYISIASGAVVDAVAALFFTQSNQARRLMTEFFDKLRIDRQFNEALRLCAAIEDAQIRSELQVRLSLFFAGIRNSTEAPNDKMIEERPSLKGQPPRRSPMRGKERVEAAE